MPLCPILVRLFAQRAAKLEPKLKEPYFSHET